MIERENSVNQQRSAWNPQNRESYLEKQYKGNNTDSSNYNLTLPQGPYHFCQRISKQNRINKPNHSSRQGPLNAGWRMPWSHSASILGAGGVSYLFCYLGIYFINFSFYRRQIATNVTSAAPFLWNCSCALMGAESWACVPLFSILLVQVQSVSEPQA